MRGDSDKDVTQPLTVCVSLNSQEKQNREISFYHVNTSNTITPSDIKYRRDFSPSRIFSAVDMETEEEEKQSVWRDLLVEDRHQ